MLRISCIALMDWSNGDIKKKVPDMIFPVDNPSSKVFLVDIPSFKKIGALCFVAKV